MMKIVLFTSGLGNQIFQYCFALWLQKQYPNEKVYGCYDDDILANHNGLEIHKVFDVTLPPTFKAIILIERIIRAFYKRTNCSIFSSHEDAEKNTIYYEGYWHDKKFIDGVYKNLRFKLANEISSMNKDMLDEINNCNSVSVHIRRGDYLLPEFEKNFCHSCPPSYYHRAIDAVVKEWPDARFFVFSDDIKWVRDNIKITNAQYIDWNTKENSPWDMFLMSECKASIIANSSFSFWGAMLGKEKKIKIRPKRWIGDEQPPIFNDEWMIIEE